MSTKKLRLVSFFFAVILIAFGLREVQAQVRLPPGCTQNHTSLVKHLFNKYHEVPIATGLDIVGKRVTVIFTAPTGTWTIVNRRVLANKQVLTCIIASGTEWAGEHKAPITKFYGRDNEAET